MEPLISVVVPMFEVDLSFVTKCFESLAGQTLDVGAFEVVVCDDGSRDLEFVDRARKLVQSQSNFHYLRNDRQRGVSATRNRAIDSARGSLIALLDADDRLAPNALRATVEFHERYPEVRYSYGQHHRIDRDGAVLKEVLGRPYDPSLLLHMNFVSPLKCFSRELHLSIGGFDASLRWAEDWDHALRAEEVLESHQIRQNPVALYEYVIHETNSIHREQLELDRWRIEVVTRALRRRGLEGRAWVSHRTDDGYTYVDWR